MLSRMQKTKMLVDDNGARVSTVGVVAGGLIEEVALVRGKLGDVGLNHVRTVLLESQLAQIA